MRESEPHRKKRCGSRCSPHSSQRKTDAMRHPKGFTRFELAVVVALVALLATVLFSKFQKLTVRAEILQVQGVVGTLRSALSVEVIRSLYLGKQLAANKHDGANAFYVIRDLLETYPENYLGVIETSDNRGAWYDDKNSQELVYVIKNDNAVSGVAGNPKKVRWRIEPIYADKDQSTVETLHATSPLVLVIKPSTPYQWEFE